MNWLLRLFGKKPPETIDPPPARVPALPMPIMQSTRRMVIERPIIRYEDPIPLDEDEDDFEFLRSHSALYLALHSMEREERNTYRPRGNRAKRPTVRVPMPRNAGGCAAEYNAWLKSLPEPTLEELTGRQTPSQEN